MAANAFPGEIGDGPISKYFCIYVFYVCAKFHTCIIKRTIHSHIGWTIRHLTQSTEQCYGKKLISYGVSEKLLNVILNMSK